MNLEIGKKISILRIAKGYTQEELAKLCGISNVAVSKWENNSTYPDIATLPVLARIFDVSIDELLSFEKTLTEEAVMHIAHEMVEAFQKKPFDEAFAFCKGFIRLYPNSELLKIRMTNNIVSISMILQGQEHGEENAKVYAEYAKKLCLAVTQSKDLMYQQAASVQMASFFTMEGKAKEALELLDAIPKLANTTSLECTLYTQLKDYDTAKKRLQQQLYADFNSLGMSINGLLAVAKAEDKKADMKAYLRLSQELDVTFHMNTSISNQQFLYYAYLEDKEQTFFYLKKYIHQLQQFDDMAELLEKQLKDTLWFSSIALDTKNRTYPKGIMKNHVREAIEDIKALDFIRDTKEFQALMDSL